MIEWVVTDINLSELLSDVTLLDMVVVTLSHYDPPSGIDVMAIGSTFIVG